MKNKKQIDIAMIINNRTLQDYLDRLELLAISLFEWENLDKICGYGASDFLEKTLYNEGQACFLYDKKLGNMVLKVAPNDKVNIYDIPTRVTAYSHEYKKQLDTNDVVIIENNKLKRSTIASIELFSYRLFDTERTIDINLTSQKTPILLEGDAKTILTLKNAYMQFSGNMPVLYGNKNFDISNKINCIKTDSPYLVDKLELHKHEIWDEALTYLGINNANTDKKERLVTDEVNSNNELINYYLNCFYKTRVKACEEINNKFLKDNNLQLKVKINKDVLYTMNKNFDIINNESGDNLE